MPTTRLRFLLQIVAALLFALPLAAAPAPEPTAPAADAATDIAEPVSVPASIRTKGVPEIDARSLRGLTPYENLRSARPFDWHPTERKVLVGTRFADSVQVHEVETPGGARRQITFYDEPVQGAFYRPGAPHEIALVKDEGGAEDFQIFLLDRRRGVAKRLTDGTSRNNSPLWSPDGGLLAFSSTARNDRDSDLWVVNPDSGERRILTEVEGSWFPVDWSPDGTRVSLIRYVSVAETNLAVVNVKSGEMTLLDEEGAEPASQLGALFSKDGGSLYVLTDRDSEFKRVLRLDLESREWTPITGDIGWDVEEYDVSDDGERMVVMVNEDGLSTLRLLDLESGSTERIEGLPPGVALGLRFRPGSREVGFGLSWARSPTDVYSWSPAQGGQLVQWTASEVGGLDVSGFSMPELVRYPTFDRDENGETRKIPAFVFRPDAKRFPGPRPVLISIHGGPEAQWRPFFLGSNNYVIEELGVAMVFPNVRGSTGYGSTYVNLDNGMKREDSVKDIGALLDWIETRPDLDENRVMVLGGSYGGYMVLASLVHYGDRLVAGFDVVGISNFVTFLQNTRDYRRDLRRAEYGDERDDAMRGFLERVSPANRAAEIETPLLVAQGANDPRVPLSESDQIVEAVSGRGTPVWYVVAEDEGHGFRKKTNTDYQRAVLIEFVKRYLLPARAEGDAAP